MLSYVAGWLAVMAGLGATAQPPEPHPLQQFPLREDGLVLRQPVLTGEPFTVAGTRGVIVGQQQGEFEAWVLPVKLLSHLTIEANVEGYPVPIDMNTMARSIEVRPDRTTITYSHIALTLTQTMFAPDDLPDGTGAVVMFHVDSVRPVDLKFRFTPEMRKMWPQLSTGESSPEWVQQGASGYYVLHTDFPDFAGAVALPGALPGIMAPYQERPQTHPLEFRLHVDPKTDRTKFYPLLMAVGLNTATSTNSALSAKLAQLEDRIPQIYSDHVAQYREQEKMVTKIVTPDAQLNADFSWAETSIHQLRARLSNGEVGLVAGYYASGDSARPGFGWFFGRDALYTLYAVNSYGDFALSRSELEFLIRRQRDDGKMMHEYSQTAGNVDWASLPYEYAAADATPLFLMAMLDYVQSSGDVAFLNAHRDAVIKAWQFETAHDADGDGIYDNAQGTGWVESWPPGMPKQEIYLALLDEQASHAMTRLAQLLGNDSVANTAKDRAAIIHATIEKEYYQPDKNSYAFSWNNGTQDHTATIFPAIAWWSAGAQLDHGAPSLRQWDSHDFATDWGVRDVDANDPLYDSMSYHQGSVWPLFTGWAAMAQYRSGNALAGYQSTMANVDLTTQQDIGAVTELLSGDFFAPFGRSTSHQLWSSAMVVTPLLRGMFGIEVDGMQHSLKVVPQLPADWDRAEVRRLHVGESVVDVTYQREGTAMTVALRQVSGPSVRLQGAQASGVLQVPLSPVEVSIKHTLPLRGARTTQMKVLSEKIEGRSLRLELEGTGASDGTLRIRRNQPSVAVKVDGAILAGDDLHVDFGSSTEYVTRVVTIHW